MFLDENLIPDCSCPIVEIEEHKFWKTRFSKKLTRLPSHFCNLIPASRMVFAHSPIPVLVFSMSKEQKKICVQDMVRDTEEDSVEESRRTHKFLD